jgi:hypothetical protein
MKTASHVCLFAALIMTAGTILGQDKTEQPKLKGALSSNWGKFPLSDQQRQAIYKIQGDYHDRIAALEKQIKMLKEQERKDMEAVLNDDQKKLLKDIILRKTGSEDKKDEKK